MTGWISVLAWIAATATPSFLGATLIQGLFVLNNPDYVFERWHGTLLYFAIILLAVAVSQVLRAWSSLADEQAGQRLADQVSAISRDYHIGSSYRSLLRTASPLSLAGPNS